MEGFPYSRPRRGQLEVAGLVEEAVRRGGVLAVQAPTGFGKTVAVLYGLVKAGAPETLYLVRTRNEITRPYMEARRLGLRASFYYSKKDMCPMITGDVELHDFWRNCALLRRSNMCPYYRNVEMLSAETIAGIVYSAETPFEAVEKLRRRGLCPYYALRKLGGLSSLHILTYPYVFSPVIRSLFLGEAGLGDYVLVIDESHSLINIADLAEQRLSWRTIERSIREINTYAPAMRGYAEKLEALLASLRRLRGGRGYIYYGKKDVLEGLGDPALWMDLSEDIREAKIAERGEYVNVRVYTYSVAILLSVLTQPHYELFARLTEHGPVLAAKPVDPAPLVRDVFENARSIVLVSGTQPPPSYYEEVLGVTREITYIDVEEAYGPVFPPENRAVVIATYVSSRYTRRGEEMYRRYAELVAWGYEALRHGVVLAVYPSYEFMLNVASHIHVPDMYVETPRTTIDEVVEKAMASEKLIVNAVAGGKLTEGVEIVRGGESLIKIVVVAGVPYPSPDDYLEKVLETLAERIGRNKAWIHLFLDTAVVKTRQAVGRAQRGPMDRALIVLADNRFLDPRIRKRLRLPVNRVVVSPGEMRRIYMEAAAYL